ncbi:MAG: hypothetical protein ABSE55_12060 [Terracidiphilus sp.]|jgi:hypothetical protein
MRRLIVQFLFLAILAASGRIAYSQTAGYYPKGGPDYADESVSLIQLIANPERYDKKIVRFIAYLHLEFEGDAVYLHRDDFEHAISNDAIWINLPRDIKADEKTAVNDRYVICTARFVAGRHGHMGMFAGELEDVTRLEVWPFVRGEKDELPPPPKLKK